MKYFQCIQLHLFWGFILTKWYVKQYILAGADLGALQVLY
ncbi:hypothetical protein HMPREF0220_3213 [Clostridioides difficile NAP08]|uniref:Uncharacterized protein n=1 Tax=Clostridioides difficile NAP08 TaxID=525259 RepID=D5Q8H9_CLODI|nr:hypothetical protein HMPREF0220_3213 [Clostridioides difficile NAP08]EFH17190.1 hypothetical protein HMPREF0219_0165 [Clostridioides difficile NAP07]